MEKMSSEDGDRYHHHHHYSYTDVLGSDKVPCGPLSGPLNRKVAGKKTAQFNIQYSSSDGYVEITFDVRNDSVAVKSVKAANGGDLSEDPELTLLAKGLEKKSNMMRTASAKIRHVGHELKRLTSFSKKPVRFDRTKSAAAHALVGLKFISKNECGHGWEAVEKRFDDITASYSGTLPRSRFGECIGMESKEFAGQLFDALARTRNIHGDSIDQ
ncbi:ROOT HAIR DEFECTIVE 2, RESPIRATORY BURST OXIDASE HOMOLOG C [Hibiscus trionum]|uniref:ROOT HAIR DEFECTIVE 2, RESPIRATORY BURST OXIDASE HOMOLOG C n=1 Tax=Hibiscus trionum TaxID=183268 RepID=A0A9W7J3U7_HIBTR|nr:ROOT HAIR DEFECTIVE 2, RESPIRATORY BURST OXIDASE HOMOLOG C [Hibiscus trionum]